MKPIKDLDELHSIILNIARTFHEICCKNNIPYYMIGGALLGTIRHHGFIPWDDDMDFGIPRKYYNHALEVLKQQLPSNYKLFTYKDKKYVWGEIAKIEDTTTLIKEKGVKDGLGHGVFIDIFPLDHTDNNYGKLSRNMMILRLLHYHKLSRTDEKNISSRVCVMLSRLLGEGIFLKLIHGLIKDHGEYITNYSGMYGKKETVPQSFIGKPTLYTFESLKLYGVEKPDDYLSSIYGDYMQLPPEDKRHIHIEYMAYK